MESITIYPKDEKQKSLLKSLLQELKVHFEIDDNNDKSLLSEKDYYTKIDKSIAQAENGKRKNQTQETQKEFLGL